MKRILICGDRNWWDAEMIEWRVSALHRSDLIIHGDARGADRMAGAAAAAFGLGLLVFPADWKTHGKKAGPIRNRQMLTEGKPDEVWAFHDDISASKGTKDMVSAAEKAGIPTAVFAHGARS